MEHVPIRVGQVRELPGGRRYTITAVGPDGWPTLTMGGGHSASWVPFMCQQDPVVGWSREHLPPPVLTANPAEVVEGEVRLDTGTPYEVAHTVVGFNDDRAPRVQFQMWHKTMTAEVVMPMVAGWRLVSRPGVTL